MSVSIGLLWSRPGHQPQSIWSGILAPLLTIFKPYRGIFFGLEMGVYMTANHMPACLFCRQWNRPAATSGDSNPWMVSTCKRIFSPVPSGRRHCLRCRWGPVARPHRRRDPWAHVCTIVMIFCVYGIVFFFYYCIMFFFFFFFALSEFMVLQCTVLHVQYWVGLFAFLVVWKCVSWKYAFWINNENQRLQCLYKVD